VVKDAQKRAVPIRSSSKKVRVFRPTELPTKGNKKGYTMGDKGRQDPGEGGHAIQQRETTRETVGDNGK